MPMGVVHQDRIVIRPAGFGGGFGRGVLDVDRLIADLQAGAGGTAADILLVCPPYGEQGMRPEGRADPVASFRSSCNVAPDDGGYRVWPCVQARP